MTARPTTGAPPAAPGGTDLTERRKRWLTLLIRGRSFAVLAVLAVLIALFSVATDNFATPESFRSITVNAALLAIIACGQGIVILTRNYDISIGSTMGLAAYVAYDWGQQYPEASVVLVPAIAVAIGIGCGAINGFLVAYARIPSIAATLGTLSVFRGALFIYADGRIVTPENIPRWAQDLVSTQVFGVVASLVIIATVTVVLAALFLRYFSIGRQIYAVGSNPEAAPFYGLDQRGVVFRAYVLCGLLAGFAGFLFGAQVSYIIQYAGQNMELLAIAAVVIGGISVLGGTGNIMGAAFGALTLATIDNGLIQMKLPEFARLVIQGGVIILAVMLDAIVQRQARGILRIYETQGLGMERITRSLSGYGWEIVLLALLVGAVVLNTNISPWYLNVNQILNGLRFIMVPGLLALALAVIVLQGEIDISLPSQVAVGTVLFGFLASQGMPYVLAVLIVVAVGAMLGAFNGIVVTSFGLPSMAVTFGTLWAYRGLAFLLPDGEYGYASTAFGEDYFWIGGTKLWGTLPVGLVMLGITALLIGLLVHRTTYGRWTYAIGNNAEAARFSGIRVGLVKTGAYALGGVIAAFGALIFVGQYESARGDNMEGQLLFIVAAVVLGGIDLMGGKGHIIGVVLSILLLGTLLNGMGLANIDSTIQLLVFGSLLVGSVLIQRSAQWGRAYLRRRAAAASAAGS